MFNRDFHTGIDFAPPYLASKKNIPVFCAADGTILSTGFNIEAGNYIIISHTTKRNLVLTFYFHLDQVLTTRGKDVCAGDTIGIMGTTGDSTDVHLHFGAAILYLSDLVFFDPANHFID